MGGGDPMLGRIYWGAAALGAAAAFDLSGAQIAHAQSAPVVADLVCGSSNYLYRRCRAPGGMEIDRVEIVYRNSRRPCDPGASWGWDPRGVWVDRGCHARFRVYASRRAAPVAPVERASYSAPIESAPYAELHDDDFIAPSGPDVAPYYPPAAPARPERRASLPSEPSPYADIPTYGYSGSDRESARDSAPARDPRAPRAAPSAPVTAAPMTPPRPRPTPSARPTPEPAPRVSTAPIPHPEARRPSAPPAIEGERAASLPPPDTSIAPPSQRPAPARTARDVASAAPPTAAPPAAAPAPAATPPRRPAPSTRRPAEHTPPATVPGGMRPGIGGRPRPRPQIVPEDADPFAPFEPRETASLEPSVSSPAPSPRPAPRTRPRPAPTPEPSPRVEASTSASGPAPIGPGPRAASPRPSLDPTPLAPLDPPPAPMPAPSTAPAPAAEEAVGETVLADLGEPVREPARATPRPRPSAPETAARRPARGAAPSYAAYDVERELWDERGFEAAEVAVATCARRVMVSAWGDADYSAQFESTPDVDQEVELAGGLGDDDGVTYRVTGPIVVHGREGFSRWAVTCRVRGGEVATFDARRLASSE